MKEVRSQEEILADIDAAHSAYFACLLDHQLTMTTLVRMRELEQELITVMGDRHEAWHLEYLSYMQAWHDFRQATNRTLLVNGIDIS
jgi:hypothetical protein